MTRWNSLLISAYPCRSPRSDSCSILNFFADVVRVHLVGVIHRVSTTMVLNSCLPSAIFGAGLAEGRPSR